ncbi:gastric triacylglycerol lipase-like [Dreissena polymorpha]|nr:gastric triacylglycerol lipase-like [Dreissena polymorpha]
MFVVSGFDVEQMNISRVPVYMGTHPAGTSIQNLLHFAQMVENPNFQMYDYGPAENMKIYHQKTPPVYDMSKIKVPIAIYHGTNDWLVGPTDVTRLIAATPTLVSKKLISGWEHLDFI